MTTRTSPSVISGLHVYKSRNIQRMIEVTGAQEVLMAIPSASRARRQEILTYLEDFPLHVRSVPGLMDLASGRVKVDDIQEVDIADLLGRDAVPPQEGLLQRCITGKVVMVTGAGGSIGSELCRQILELGHDLAAVRTQRVQPLQHPCRAGTALPARVAARAPAADPRLGA
jgi:FlaA1/EpsC-like NDP-sugar epimerase